MRDQIDDREERREVGREMIEKRGEERERI